MGSEMCIRDRDKDYISCLNPESLEVLTGCKLEKMLASAAAPAQFQFLRMGYFCVDSKDSAPGHLVFNRAVALKDSFKKYPARRGTWTTKLR